MSLTSSLLLLSVATMSLLTYRILFFTLVPIGLLILIKAVKILISASNGQVLLQLPYNDNIGAFTITKAGYHSIWQKGPILQKTPLAKFRPHIRNTVTGEVIPIHRSIMSPRSNSFSNGEMEIFTFHAPKGEYEMSLVTGSSISSVLRLVGNALPLPDMDTSKYSLEVRESQSQFLTFLAIPMILLGVAGMAGGLVLGLIADQIFI